MTAGRPFNSRIKGRPYEMEAYADELIDHANPPPPDVVPTVDAAEPVAAYPDWDAASSFVVSGPLGGRARFRGRRYATPEAAKAALVERYGRVLAFHTIPGRYFGRVPRPT